MIDRCYLPKNKQYKDYGGRGIRVCPQWRQNYKQFYTDMAPRPTGLTLDRIDNNKDYTPENCRWATRKEQQRNQRQTRKATLDGQEYLGVELAEMTGMKTDTIMNRIGAGLSFEEVISPKRRIGGNIRKAARISAEKRRAKTHCKSGHAFTVENTYMNGTQRSCRRCHTLREFNRRAKIS